MIELDVSWNFGFILGFMIADEEQCIENGLSWGFSLQLGPIGLSLWKHSLEEIEE